MKTKPRPKLVQCDPWPMFEICAPGPAYWRVVMGDDQSDDRLYFTCTRGKWTAQDIAIAAARQAANGKCVCAVQHYPPSGVPDSFARFAVLYAWNRWNVHPF